MKLRAGICNARLSLHRDQFGGFNRQRGVVATEGLGDHLQGLVEVTARVHQVNGRLHGFRSANRLEDRHYGIGMGQGVFAGVQRFAGNQGVGKCPRTDKRIRLLGQAVGSSHSDRTVSGLRVDTSLNVGDVSNFAFHKLSQPRVQRHPEERPSQRRLARLRQTWAHVRRLRSPPGGRAGRAPSWRGPSQG